MIDDRKKKMKDDSLPAGRQDDRKKISSSVCFPENSGWIPEKSGAFPEKSGADFLPGYFSRSTFENTNRNE